MFTNLFDISNEKPFSREPRAVQWGYESLDQPHVIFSSKASINKKHLINNGVPRGLCHGKQRRSVNEHSYISLGQRGLQVRLWHWPAHLPFGYSCLESHDCKVTGLYWQSIAGPLCKRKDNDLLSSSPYLSQTTTQPLPFNWHGQPDVLPVSPLAFWPRYTHRYPGGHRAIRAVTQALPGASWFDLLKLNFYFLLTFSLNLTIFEAKNLHKMRGIDVSLNYFMPAG